MEEEKNQWVRGSLLAHFGSLLGTNMGYLHNTLNWAITILLGGTVFTLNREKFPDIISLLTLNILLVIIFHLAIRTSKAYLNVIRCSTLEKSIISNGLDNENPDWDKVTEEIKSIHCKWESPLKKIDVAKKVFFELGFLYFTLPVVFLSLYVSYKLPFNCEVIFINFFTLILLTIECYFGIVKSPYYQKITENDQAKEIK